MTTQDLVKRPDKTNLMDVYLHLNATEVPEVSDAAKETAGTIATAVQRAANEVLKLIEALE